MPSDMSVTRPCICLVEGPGLTIGALEVKVDHVPRVQEGQAARDVQRNGFPEAWLPPPLRAALPADPKCISCSRVLPANLGRLQAQLSDRGPVAH